MDFGAPGWVHLNFGCAPTLLDHTLIRLQQAIENADSAPRACPPPQRNARP
jgi:hypothetical protein